MKKLIVLGVLGIAVVSGAVYSKSFLDGRYENNYSLASNMLENCASNLTNMVNAPSTFNLLEAKIYLGGPYFKDDEERYISSSEFLQDLVRDSSADFLPLNVHAEFETQSLTGGAVAIAGVCRYAALEFPDGDIEAITLMAVSAGDNVISNPRIYGSESQAWFKLESDIDSEFDFKKMFNNAGADVSTRRLENQPI